MTASRIPSHFVFAAGGDFSEGTEAPRPGSLRSHKKDRTRRALLDAADRLFQDKGYEATTLDEICEAAGISLRTFFRYFESKRDLALYENMRNIARLRELFARRRSPAGMLDELESLYEFMALEFEQDEAARARLFRLMKEPSLAARILILDLDTEARIAAVLAAGLPEGEAFDARMAATMLVGGIRSVVSDWAQAQGRHSLRMAIARVFSAARRSGLIAWVPRARADA